MRNPILKKSDDLFVLDTRDIADPKVVKTVRNTEQIVKKSVSKVCEKNVWKRKPKHSLIP